MCIVVASGGVCEVCIFDSNPPLHPAEALNWALASLAGVGWRCAISLSLLLTTREARVPDPAVEATPKPCIARKDLVDFTTPLPRTLPGLA